MRVVQETDYGNKKKTTTTSDLQQQRQNQQATGSAPRINTTQANNTYTANTTYQAQRQQQQATGTAPRIGSTASSLLSEARNYKPKKEKNAERPQEANPYKKTYTTDDYNAMTGQLTQAAEDPYYNALWANIDYKDMWNDEDKAYFDSHTKYLDDLAVETKIAKGYAGSNQEIEETKKDYQLSDVIDFDKDGKGTWKNFADDLNKYNSQLADLEATSKQYDNILNNAMSGSLTEEQRNEYKKKSDETKNLIDRITEERDSLQSLQDFQNALAKRSQLEYLRENGTMDEYTQYAQYVGGYANSTLDDIFLNVEASQFRKAAGIVTFVENVKQLYGEKKSAQVEETAKKLYTNGEITGDEMNELFGYAREILDKNTTQPGESVGLALNDIANQLTLMQENGESAKEKLFVNVVGNVIDNMASQYGPAVAFGNIGMKANTAVMAFAEYAPTFQKNMEAGYTLEESMMDAGLRTGIEFVSELIGGERILNYAEGDIVPRSIAQLVWEGNKSGVAESVEEGLGWSLEPLAHALSTGEMPSIEDWDPNELKEAVTTAYLAGFLQSGLMTDYSQMGTEAPLSQTEKILDSFLTISTDEGKQRVQEFVRELDKMAPDASIRKNITLPDGTKISERDYIGIVKGAAARQLAEYDNKSQVKGVEIINPNRVNTIEGLAEESKANLGNSLEISRQEQVNSLLQSYNAGQVMETISQKLEQNAAEKAIAQDNEMLANIQQAAEVSPKQFSKWTAKQKLNVLQASGYAKALNLNVGFDDSFEGDGYYDPKTKKIMINPNSEMGEVSTMVHELTHLNENSRYYKDLKRIVEEEYKRSGKDIKAAETRLIKEYAKHKVDISKGDLANREFVAIEVQSRIGTKEFVEKLIRYNENLAYRMFKNIQAMTTSDVKTQLENTFMQAFRDVQTAQAEAKNSARADIQYSFGKTWEDVENRTKTDKSFVNELKNKGIKSLNELRESWVQQKMDSFTSNDAYEISREDAVSIVRENIPSNILDGWFRNADSSYKEKLETLILENDDLRNAGLNLAYDNYKTVIDGGISFDEFLNKELTLYRGVRGQTTTDKDVFLAYTYDEKMAKRFGNNVKTISIKPIDTLGSYETTAETEILVPTEKTEFKTGDVQYSFGVKHNAEYMEAVNTGDMETAQRLVNEAAEDAAKRNGMKVFSGFHGTNAMFNKFSKEKLGSKNFLAESAYMGFFMAGSKETAESYTGVNTGDMFRISFDKNIQDYRQQLSDKYNLDELRAQDDQARNQYIEDAFEKAVEENTDKDAALVRRARDIRNGLIKTDIPMRDSDIDIFENVAKDWWRGNNYARLRDEYNDNSEQHQKLKELDRQALEEFNQYLLDYFGYKPNVKNLFAFMRNPLYHDFKGEGRDVDFSALMKEAKKNGNDGGVLENVQDGGDFDTIYFVFDPEQFKSSDPVTYDDNGNVIPLSERFNFNTDDIRYSFGVENDNTNLENVGYHYGRKNLNPKTKSERLYQRSGRGTGAFGTGLYVFGENGENRESYGKNLTEHEIDLSNYNMFKPQDSEEGYRLHRLFKELDDNYSYEGPKTKEELKQTVSDLVNELNEIEYNENGDAIVSPEFEAEIRDRLMALEDDERYVDDLLEDNRTSEGGELLADYLADELTNRYIDERAYGRKSPKSLDWVDDYEIAMSHIPELAKILKEDEAVVRNAVDEAIRTANEDRNKPDFWGGNYDSVGTRVMKQLGYEGIDVRGLKGLDNSTYGTVIYDLKPESLRGRMSNNSFASVAPFRKEDATPENWESLKERSKPFLENAKKIADDLGLKMVRTTPVFGAFEGDNELSYEIEIEGKNRDQVDLYAYILGDIGQEGQKGVLISDYVAGNDDANSMELSFMVKDVDAAAKVLNDLGVAGYSSPEGSNVINITQGTYEYEDSYEKLAQGVVELERRIREGLGDNYAGTEKSSSNSRYAEPDDRRRVYQERLAAYQEQQQNGNEDNREIARIKEALEALNKNFPEESAQEGAFLNSDDDLNISEKDLENYQTRITPTTERKYNNDRNIDMETGVLKPKAIVELETTIGKTTHEAEIEDGQDYAGMVAQQLDAGVDPETVVKNLKSGPLDNGLVRAYYTAQVLADRGYTSEYREVAQWARDIDNLGGKLVESTKILYSLDDSFSRAVYLEKVQQNLIDEYKAKYGKKSKIDIDQTINDIFQQYYDQIIGSKTAREFSTALGALVRKANAAMPKTAWDRITQYRMWAMLSGTKTATGNLVSNLASLGLYRLNGVNQALLESALKKVDIKRVDETKTYKIDQSQRNATFNKDSKTSKKNKALAKEVWKQIGEDVKSKYGEDVEKIPDIVKKNILTDNKNLKSPLRRAVDTATDIAQRIQNVMLNDAPVSRLAFIQKFDELAQVRGINVDTIDKKSKAYAKLIDDAYDYAEEVVSHNATDISNTLSNIQKRSSTNVRVNEGSFLEGLDKTIKNIKQKSNEGQIAYRFLDNTMMTLQKWFIPFYKTNASIMQKSLQYSPLEWVQVANDFNKVKNGRMDLVDLVEHMSKAVTGTELYILGAIFAYLGWLKWDRDDEDYSGRLSIKVPNTDKGYTVDFIDPASTIFAKGVVLAQDFAENGLSFKTLHDLVNDYEDIFLSDELDMFSSMKDFFDTVGKVKKGEDDYGEYTLSDGATDMAFSILNSYIPAIVRDISRIADPAKKVVYDTNNKKYLFNRLLNSTPFRNKLVDKKDATGNTVTYTQPFTKNDVFNRILTQMVSRGKLVDLEGNTVQGKTNESSLGEKAGEFNQMAKDFQYNDTNGDGYSDTHWIRETVPANIYPGGNKVELNPEERDTYGKTWTDTWTSGANALASNDVYQGLDYEKQADVVYELQAFSRECIEAQYCKDHDLEMTDAQKTSYDLREFCTTNGKVDGYLLSLVALGNAKENKNATGGQQYVMGLKDKDGKTIKNSRQLRMRQLYENAGVYDEIVEAIHDGKFTYADFGLSKTVVEKYSKEQAKKQFEDAYKETMDNAKSNTSGGGKSAKTSKKKSSKISGSKKAGKLNLIAPVQEIKPQVKKNNFVKAYADTLNKSKKTSTDSGGSVVCPKCGNRVSSGTERCPVCGTKIGG